MISKRSHDFRKAAYSLGFSFAGVAFALFFGALLLLALSVNPLHAYSSLFSGAVGNKFAITGSLVKATPLLLVGAGICIAFRANVINIGGEGQIIAGAIGGAWIPIALNSVTGTSLPGIILIPLTCLTGFLFGAVWGFIPGILKAKLKVNEILSTIMMNAIALQLMNLLLQGPLMDPANVARGTYLAQSATLPEQVWLPRLLPPTLLHSGFLIALAFAFLAWLFLWRTTIGYQIRAVGLNPHASRYSGINVAFNEALSLTLAGGFCGLAGVIEVIGVQHRLMDGITAGYGFTGIVAALLGGLHPLGLIPASVLFGGLLVGADRMQRAVQVPSALITAILGLMVLFASGAAQWSRKLSDRRQAKIKRAEVAKP